MAFRPKSILHQFGLLYAPVSPHSVPVDCRERLSYGPDFSRLSSPQRSPRAMTDFASSIWKKSVKPNRAKLDTILDSRERQV